MFMKNDYFNTHMHITEHMLSMNVDTQTCAEVPLLELVVYHSHVDTLKLDDYESFLRRKFKLI